MNETFQEKIKRIFEAACASVDEDERREPTNIWTASERHKFFEGLATLVRERMPGPCKPHLITFIDPISPHVYCGKCKVILSDIEHNLRTYETQSQRKRYKRRWERGR